MTGWRIVPYEPTFNMLDEGLECLHEHNGTNDTTDVRGMYRAMLNAAPRIEPVGRLRHFVGGIICGLLTLSIAVAAASYIGGVKWQPVPWQ